MTGIETEFMEIFRDEARERLDRIVETLLALESGRGAADAVDSLFRDTHTIKGGAGMVGLEQIGDLAHAMEDVLAKTRESGSYRPSRPSRCCAQPMRCAARGGRRRAHAAASSRSCSPASPRPAAVCGARSPEPGPSDSRAGARAEPAAAALRDQGARSACPPRRSTRLLDLVGETVLHGRRLEHVLGEDGATGADQLSLRRARRRWAAARRAEGRRDRGCARCRCPRSSRRFPAPCATRDRDGQGGRAGRSTATDTELDRVILESLSEPLVHILRNAVAHGIELPEEREQRRQAACGRLELRAEQRGGIVEVDRRRRRPRRARRKRSPRHDGQARSPTSSPGRLLDGGTEVSEISGRGVGLDAVKKQVESYGGSVEVRSEPGQGTESSCVLPLALALLEVLLVERAGNVYRLPAREHRGGALGRRTTMSLAGRPALELRGTSIPVADLAELVGATAPPPADRAPAIIVHARAGGASLRSATPARQGRGRGEGARPAALALAHGYLGAAILGDGRIALLVDPASLVHGAQRARSAVRPRRRTRPGARSPTRRRCSSSKTRSRSASSSAASSRPPATASRPPATVSEAFELLGATTDDRARRHGRRDAEMNGLELTPRSARDPTRGAPGHRRHVARRRGRPSAPASRQAPTPTW